jgi:hypothetical protein
VTQKDKAWLCWLAAGISALLVVTIAVPFSFGFNLGRKGTGGVVTIAMDAPPELLPQDRPRNFREALQNAADLYFVEYKLLLCFRLSEMGARGNEMGVQAISSICRTRHPEFSQAYAAARIIAIRQKEFSSSTSLQHQWSKKKYPFIAYCCYRWAPASGWEKYYWNPITKHGIAYFYSGFSTARLEEIIEKRERS